MTPIETVPTKFPYFEISDIQQGTQSWLDWRKKVIGASEAGVILGENHWQSRENLIQEKMGLREGFQGNANTREGHELESQARSLIEKTYGIKIKPTIVQDGQLPFIAASLDGISDKHDQVFEIKCGEKSYALAAKNEIPNYYYGQLQHILMVTQLDKISYVAFRPFSELIILELGRDGAYIDRMRILEQNFASVLIDRGHEIQNSFRGVAINRK